MEVMEQSGAVRRLNQLAKLVIQTRVAQTAYFNQKTHDRLLEARRLEAQVDAAAKESLEFLQTLEA